VSIMFNDRFLILLSDFAPAQTLSCGNGNLFTTSSAYGGCYGTDYVASTSTLDYGCTQATTRNGVQSGGVVTCVPGSVFWTCITQTIFATFPNISPVTNYFCGGSYSALTIYRDFPSTLSSTLTSSSFLELHLHKPLLYNPDSTIPHTVN